ncbi:terminase small subunit [Delftia lacustris]|uniref:terminase small subunit n=1 Tax=Delftia lacustris TaxID=558537 RepID=UPI00193BB4CB|nr:terminase small subunit [Delftia lacustris]QRI92516.1 terminase small subunit [Delftia lacustris]
MDLNGTQAAIRAGYSAKTARQIASENLSKPHIQVAIAEARKQQQERTQITADAMLQQAWLIATADARELIETKVACCRHCWGELPLPAHRQRDEPGTRVMAC